MTVEQDFLPFAAGPSANVLSQSAYAALTALLQNGMTSGIVPSAQLNKILRQSSIISAVVAQLIADRTGNDVIDDGTTATILANLKAATAALNGDSGQVFSAANPVSGSLGDSQVLNRQYADERYAPISSSPILGATRNARMSIAAASASGTFTADEVVVESALGGTPFKLSSFSQTLNLATVGAGGMDTGAAPASGFVAIYASCKAGGANPGIFACNATTSSGSVYSGSNAPAGVVATALIGIWPTTAASLLAVGYQIDREISLLPTSVLSTSTAQTSYTSLSLTNVVPAAAKTVSGVANSTTSNGYSTSASAGIAASAAGIAGQSAIGSGYASLPFRTPLITQQTLYYTLNVGQPGTLTGGVSITGYSF